MSKTSRKRSCDPKEEVEIRLSSPAEEEPITVGQFFQQIVLRFPKAIALKYKGPDGLWIEFNYSQYYGLCVQAAKSFLKLGLAPFDGVIYIGYSTPQFHVTHFGTIFAGGIAAASTAHGEAEACYWSASNCRASVIVVEDNKQLERVKQVWNRLPYLKAVVLCQGKEESPDNRIFSWHQFLEFGGDLEDSKVEMKIIHQRVGQCAAIVYSSGTTGQPKGIMLSHDNLTWSAKVLHAIYSPIIGSSVNFLSYREPAIVCLNLDVYYPLVSAGTVHYAPHTAGRNLDDLLEAAREVKPPLLCAVTRVWEDLKSRLENEDENGQKPGDGEEEYTNILKQFKVLLTAGSSVSLQLLQFYRKEKLAFVQAYGMTENTGGIAVNLSTDDSKLSSVGTPYTGTSVKINNPDQDGNGEICCYGRQVCMGYLYNEELTQALVDDDGWLHTGDIGRLDKDGLLYLTGRIADVIKTSGPAKVYPVPIEERLKKELPFISHAVVIGEAKDYLTCLLTFQCTVDPKTCEVQDELSPNALTLLSKLGSKCRTVSEVVGQRDPCIYGEISKGLERLNNAAIYHKEHIKKFTILEKDFCVSGGELSHTKKLKRQVISKKYQREIQAMYQD